MSPWLSVMPVASHGAKEQEFERAQSLSKEGFPNAMVRARRQRLIALTGGAGNHPLSGFSSSRFRECFGLETTLKGHVVQSSARAGCSASLVTEKHFNTSSPWPPSLAEAQ